VTVIWCLCSDRGRHIPVITSRRRAIHANQTQQYTHAIGSDKQCDCRKAKFFLTNSVQTYRKRGNKQSLGISLYTMHMQGDDMSNIQQRDRISAVVTELESIEHDYGSYTYEIDCAIRNLLPIIDEDGWSE